MRLVLVCRSHRRPLFRSPRSVRRRKAKRGFDPRRSGLKVAGSGLSAYAAPKLPDRSSGGSPGLSSVSQNEIGRPFRTPAALSPRVVST